MGFKTADGIMKEMKGLKLNDSFYTVPDLVPFCQNEIKEGTGPDWKLEVYSFILDFLDESKVIRQQTSGTTGARKTIELPKNSMLTSAKNTVDFFQLKEGDVAVLCLPIEYIAGKMMVVRALLAGLNLKLIQPSGTPDFTGIEKTDFCAMVPMQASHLLQNNLWPKMKTLLLGGAETGSELHEQLQYLDTLVFETYGMAETSSHVALRQLNGIQRETAFTALPNVQLSTDERGCLVIIAAYLPEKIVTNDRVQMASSSRFKWLGRFDNIINSGGIKVQPEILEKQFQEILQKPCAIFGKSDEMLGQKMVLVVETIHPDQPEEVLAKLAPQIERKMLPKEIYFVPSLPRNKSYKIDHRALRKMF